MTAVRAIWKIVRENIIIEAQIPLTALFSTNINIQTNDIFLVRDIQGVFLT